MLALNRPVRSEVELRGWRAQAQEQLDDWGPNSPYIRETRPAVLEVLDWLLGECTEAPATHEPVAPDDRTVVTERLRAESLETEGGDEQGSAAHYGRVGLVLAWATLDPDVESPL